MVRIIIADEFGQHGIDIKTAISIGYGSDISDQIEIVPYWNSALSRATSDTNIIALIRSTTGVASYSTMVSDIYPRVQTFFPMGSNAFVDVNAFASGSNGNVPIVVTCGAGDPGFEDKNVTGYGYGLEFWDRDLYVNGTSPDASSFSNGVILGKLLLIKDTRGGSWWNARYSARTTAIRTESNRITSPWDLRNGFGLIDTALAIAYNSTIISDPYIYGSEPEVPTPQEPPIVNEYTAAFVGTGTRKMSVGRVNYSLDISGSIIISGSVGNSSSIPSGSNSHTSGENTIASGSYSHSEGNFTTSIGQASHAEGDTTTSIGNKSHAEGWNTISVGNSSHAEGYLTKTVGEESHAEGRSSTSIGEWSHSEGFNTTSNDYYSHVEGYYSRAVAVSSHAEGLRTYTLSANSSAKGYNTYTGNYYLSGTNVTILGQSEFQISNVDEADANVMTSLMVGSALYIVGDGVLSGVVYTDTILYDLQTQILTVAISGNADWNSWDWFSIVVKKRYEYGFDDNQETIPEFLSNINSVEGYSSIAVGGGSHAEGGSTKSIGTHSHSEGGYTTSVGEMSHAEGQLTISVGGSSHAEGNGSTSIGEGSHAEGAGSRSIGQSSHAEGELTTSLGHASHCSGRQSISRNAFEDAYSVDENGQFSRYGLYLNTTDATPAILYIRSTEEIIIPSGSTAMYKIDLVGRSRYATNKSAAYQLTGVTYISSSFASSQLLVNNKTVVYETDATWDANVGINTTNGNLRVTVTGSADSVVNWYANVEITSVYNNL